jgi:hypothetical protein
MDESQYTVEWMVTAGKYAKELNIESMIDTNSFVRPNQQAEPQD